MSPMLHAVVLRGNTVARPVSTDAVEGVASLISPAGSSNGISVDLVKVSNCCSLPCYFTKGENVSVTVVFTAGK